MSVTHPTNALIDFNQPWYHYLTYFANFPELEATHTHATHSHAPAISIVENLNACLDGFEDVNASRIANFEKLPIRFVEQACLPEGEAYESFIAKTGKIPTRDNHHDLLNGLIWLNFPQAKAVLNELHAKDILRHGIHNARTALRNALTVFDENGGIVVSSDRLLLEQLQAFKWQAALVTHRANWLAQHRTIAFFPFGHALLEKLLNPRKNITSHTLLILVDEDWFAQSIASQRNQLDTAIANMFRELAMPDLAGNAVKLSSKSFQPLPVMGIPGYSADNVIPAFYQDEAVFRHPRAFSAPIFPLHDG
ncbi:hypothetical protein A9Z64_01810 [Moraxella osloensis]|uniref:Protein of uncharacterized function (DUF3025) n=1 Tax=Faucicola osloensis TaxID=34062 RepID=A0A378Q8X8_FAUOS|nr:DUF3025 domain-containing protein [Moraxella osloensis]AME00703.1 hypothetical protein AXE82_02045 [Moraxella osloensis]OBX52645.1 hypothetical protein A9Z64_01810 [Moraxella osloensis]QPT41704.1 DUF3025 domain-containing protein [Moraxella osloensis]STY97280.1 Protein of uncharacterised function (DUF3025) [Moraxella osloensis]